MKRSGNMLLWVSAVLLVAFPRTGSAKKKSLSHEEHRARRESIDHTAILPFGKCTSLGFQFIIISIVCFVQPTFCFLVFSFSRKYAMSRRERVQIRGAKKSFGSKGLAVGTAVQLSNAKSDAATKNCTAGVSLCTMPVENMVGKRKENNCKDTCTFRQQQKDA